MVQMWLSEGEAEFSSCFLVKWLGGNSIPAGGDYPHVHALAPISGTWVYPLLHLTARLVFHMSWGKPAGFYIPSAEGSPEAAVPAVFTFSSPSGCCGCGCG